MLTSARNPKIASAARLRKRALRDHDRRFLLEGSQAVGEALDSGRLESLFTSDDLAPIALKARQMGVETHLVAGDVVRHLTSTVTPQALVGVAAFLDIRLGEALGTAFEQDPDGCVALLHEVRDPGNAGTVLRSADAAGASAVVFSETSVDVYNPKTVRASAGSIFHLSIVRGATTIEAIEHARGLGARVLAMSAESDADLYRTDLSGPVVFVFGNEAHGLSEEILGAADARVRVPQSGRAESLNLAAAATVCMFEWRRRRLPAPDVLENIIGAAAHDIRSPLTAMKGFGYALERRWESMSEQQRGMMLQGIVHDADRMDTILRQLVDSARVVGGNLEVFKEQTDIGDLVRGVAQAQRREPDHPAVEWIGEDQIVFADPARLKTSLLAFCESLVWWGSEGAVVVDAGVDRGTLWLRASRSVADLTPGDVDGLFTPRRPGEGAASKIGLFVARGVAEAQGGRCWAAVDDGVLTFSLELPAGPPDAAP